jgi:hypothetical protein
VFAQKRLVRSSSVSVFDWIAALERPKSRTTSAMLTTAAAMATRPKSPGTSSLARMIVEPNCRMTRIAWLRSVTPEPRAAALARFTGVPVSDDAAGAASSVCRSTVRPRSGWPEPPPEVPVVMGHRPHSGPKPKPKPTEATPTAIGAAHTGSRAGTAARIRDRRAPGRVAVRACERCAMCCLTVRENESP